MLFLYSYMSTEISHNGLCVKHLANKWIHIVVYDDRRGRQDLDSTSDMITNQKTINWN